MPRNDVRQVKNIVM